MAVGQRRAAEVVADTQKYFAIVNEVREAVAQPRLGWTWEARQKLDEAASIATVSRDTVALRNLALLCATSVDLRRIDPPLEPSGPAPLGEIAVDSAGERLAVGKLKGGFALEVFVFDTRSLTLQRTSSFGIVGDHVHALSADFLKKKLGNTDADPTKKPQEDLVCLAFSPDGSLLAAGTRNGRILVWNLANEGRLLKEWLAHDKDVESLTFSPDGLLLLSARDEIKLWDARQDWNPVAISDWKASWFAIHPDGQRAARVQGKTVSFARLSNGETQATWPISSVGARPAFGADGQLLALATESGIAEVDPKTRLRL